MRVPGNLRIDSPAWPLLQAEITYWGITDAAGSALGLTIVDSRCSTAGLQPNYAGQSCKILDGDCAGQVRQIMTHDLGTGTLTFAAAFTDYNGAVFQVPASTRFVILSTAGGGGAPPPAPPAPSVGLWMFGMCSPAMLDSTTVLLMPNLAGFNNDIFNNEFWCQIIHNADAPGTAPEREIRRITDYVGATGTFTVDAFTVPVQANDLVCIFHESIMAIEILGYGTLTTSSATVPADTGRTEAAGSFDGCLLMPTEGACAFQPRRIVDYSGPALDIFTLDPNYPFTALPGLVDYIIIGDQCGFEWPYIQATMTFMDGPDLDQADIEICRLSIHNLRPDGAIIPVAEFTTTPLIDIDRYRWGVDAGWTSIVANAAMGEFAGYANYTYTWPNANWQLADFFRLTTHGMRIRIPSTAPAGIQDIWVPPQTKYGVVGGLSNIKKKLNLVFDIVNAILKLTETGGTINTTVINTEYDVYINDNPLGVFEPRKVMVELSNHTVTEVVIIRVYYRIASGGSYILKDIETFNGLIEPPPTVNLLNVDLEPNRFGTRVTVERRAGSARDYPWEVLYEMA